MSGPGFVDTHAHLDGYGDELDDVLRRAGAAGVVGIVAVGIDLASAQFALQLADRRAREAPAPDHPALAVAVGLHPHNTAGADGQLAPMREHLAAAVAAGLPAAVGEIGLDYYRDRAPRAAQRAAFWAQLEWAHELSLPVVVHDRDAHQDVLAILRGAAPLPRGGVMHCYSGDRAMAEACLELGMYISVAGPVTFPKATGLRELAAVLPLERLLVETDCPYLTPVPHRGQRNEPAYVAYTARAVAALRREDDETALAAMWANADRLFWAGGLTVPSNG